MRVYFTNNIICLYDKLAPMRQIKVKHLLTPRLTENINDIQKKDSKGSIKV